MPTRQLMSPSPPTLVLLFLVILVFCGHVFVRVSPLPVVRIHAIAGNNTSSSTSIPIYIGAVTTPTYPDGSSLFDATRRGNDAIRMWKQHLDKQGGILGRPVVIVSADHNFTEESGLIATRALLDYGVVALVYTELGFNVPSFTECENREIPCMGMYATNDVYICGEGNTWQSQPPCRGPNTARFQYHHAMYNLFSSFVAPFMSLLKIKKATSVAFVSNTWIGWAETVPYAKQAAQDNGFNILKEIQFYSEGDGSYDFLPIVTELRSLNPDGLHISIQNCSAIMFAFKAIDWLPKAINSLWCVDSTLHQQTLGKHIRYITGPSQWDHRLHGTDYTETHQLPVAMFPVTPENSLPSPLQYRNVFKQLTGNEPDDVDAMKLSEYVAIEGGIILSNSTIPTKINQGIKNLYQPSYFGILSTNPYGYNLQKSVVTLQCDGDGVNQVISPLQAATSDFIYPMPQFYEREYYKVMYGTKSEIGMIVLVGLLSIISLGMIIFFIIYRETKIIRSTSVLFSLIVMVGSMTCYGACLTWPVENNDVTCAIRPWFITLSFLMVITPLLAKTYRIARFFNQTISRVMRMPDGYLLCVIALLSFPQIIINIIWSSMDPLRAVIVTADPLRPYYSNTTCTSNNPIFFYLTLIYCGILILGLCYLAWKIRHAFEVFDDSKPIVTSVFVLVCMLTLVGLAHGAVAPTDRGALEILFVLRSLGVCGGVLGMLVILYGAKMLRVWDARKQLDAMGSAGKTRRSTGSQHHTKASSDGSGSGVTTAGGGTETGTRAVTSTGTSTGPGVVRLQSGGKSHMNRHRGSTSLTSSSLAAKTNHESCTRTEATASPLVLLAHISARSSISVEQGLASSSTLTQQQPMHMPTPTEHADTAAGLGLGLAQERESEPESEPRAVTPRGIVLH